MRFQLTVLNNESKLYPYTGCARLLHYYHKRRVFTWQGYVDNFIIRSVKEEIVFHRCGRIGSSRAGREEGNLFV